MDEHGTMVAERLLKTAEELSMESKVFNGLLNACLKLMEAIGHLRSASSDIPLEHKEKIRTQVRLLEKMINELDEIRTSFRDN